ncbi:MAG: hypothetical protein WCB27_02270 [Thermoguttaceae bacterium]
MTGRRPVGKSAGRYRAPGNRNNARLAADGTSAWAFAAKPEPPCRRLLNAVRWVFDALVGTHFSGDNGLP